MAPEVIRNERVTEKCDVWSFGVVVWELSTLEVPYAGMEMYCVMWLVAKHGMRLHIPEGCPERLATMMMQCMNPNPRDRPDAMTLVNDIISMRNDGILV